MSNRNEWKSAGLAMLVCLLGCAGCGGNAGGGHAGGGGNDPYGYGSGYPVDYRQIQFRDDAPANAKVEGNLADLEFVDNAGMPILLKDHLGKKNLVLVVTRGVTTPVCVYCTTQTSRLISAYGELSQRDAEVFVVYPVDKPANQQRFAEFLASTREKLSTPGTKVPFPLALDLNLVAVDRLGIRQDLAKPATYIFDKQGEVRFAYVGQTVADRHSVKAILAQLDEINREEK